MNNLPPVVTRQQRGGHIFLAIAFLFFCTLQLFISAARMDRPSAPRVGEVTHHSIELTWEDDLQRANHRLARATARRPTATGDERVKVELEQREDVGSWTGLYVSVRTYDLLSFLVMGTWLSPDFTRTWDQPKPHLGKLG